MVNPFGLITATVTLTQAVADVVASTVANAYEDLRGAMRSTSAWDHVVVTDLRTEGAPEFESVNGGFPLVGTDSGEDLPYQNAAVITWRTALRGRSFRGRTYLGGFTESFSSGRNIS